MVSKIFSQLEKLAHRVQLKYMRPRITSEVVEAGRIRFHPHDARKWIMEEYRKRLKKMGVS